MTINRTLCLLVALWLSAPVRSAELGAVELRDELQCRGERSRSTRPRAAPSHDVRERAEILCRGRGCAARMCDRVLGTGDDLRASALVGSAVDIDLRQGRVAGRYGNGRRQEDGSRTRVRRGGAGLLQGRQNPTRRRRICAPSPEPGQPSMRSIRTIRMPRCSTRLRSWQLPIRRTRHSRSSGAPAN